MPNTKRNRRPPTPMEDTRVANLKFLINRHGGAHAIAEKLDYKTPAFISHLVTSYNPFTERTARSFEQKLALPQGWLDIERAESDEFSTRPGPRLRPAAPTEDRANYSTLIKDATRAIQDAAKQEKVEPKMDQIADMLTLVVDNAELNGGAVDTEFVHTMVRLLGQKRA